ncbi:MAG: gephyrin-like molybdotransferase Glp [Naasia sp.]
MAVGQDHPSAPQGTVDHGRRSVAEHAAIVAALLDGWTAGHETVPLVAALGRVTAAEVASPVDLPLFRNSQMDGFAVTAASIETIPATLVVGSTIAAAPGAPELLAAGTAARIMTGAQVPEGADCIVPVEYTREGDAGTIVIERGQRSGDFIREPGSDVRVGDVLVGPGMRLGPRHLAALAASGVDRVEVRTPLRVAVISSGAELVAPGEAVAPGQVYDANTVALTTAVLESGALVVETLRTEDDPDAFRVALARAVGGADLVITSGGVSKGAFEVVRDVLEPLGATVTEVAMQPGGPQCTALIEQTPVISFPGNPVSAQVSFAVFLRPVLRRLAGLPAIATRPATLDHPVESVAGKRQWLRGVRSDSGSVSIVSGPGSHLVATMAAADCLVDIPESTTHLDSGDTVEVLPL